MEGVGGWEKVEGVVGLEASWVREEEDCRGGVWTDVGGWDVAWMSSSSSSGLRWAGSRTSW